MDTRERPAVHLVLCILFLAQPIRALTITGQVTDAQSGPVEGIVVMITR